MTENIVISGFEIELELELKPNQSPKRKKRSLDNNSVNSDYELENNNESIIISVGR